MDTEISPSPTRSIRAPATSERAFANYWRSKRPEVERFLIRKGLSMDDAEEIATEMAARMHLRLQDRSAPTVQNLDAYVHQAVRLQLSDWVRRKRQTRQVDARLATLLRQPALDVRVWQDGATVRIGWGARRAGRSLSDIQAGYLAETIRRREESGALGQVRDTLSRRLLLLLEALTEAAGGALTVPEVRRHAYALLAPDEPETLSLDAPVSKAVRPLGEILPDATPGPEELALADSLRQQLLDAIESAPARSRAALLLGMSAHELEELFRARQSAQSAVALALREACQA